VLTAADLVTWSKLICFVSVPDLASCEIATCLYRVRHGRLHPLLGSNSTSGSIETWR
jgi:hypothetical protein